MEGDFEGQMEDLPPDNDSGSEEEAGDEDRLQQELGDVGDAGDTVDERLWNEEDKPEENQQGPPKKEKDSTVQASSLQSKGKIFTFALQMLLFSVRASLSGLGQSRLSTAYCKKRLFKLLKH